MRSGNGWRRSRGKVAEEVGGTPELPLATKTGKVVDREARVLCRVRCPGKTTEETAEEGKKGAEREITGLVFCVGSRATLGYSTLLCVAEYRRVE